MQVSLELGAHLFRIWPYSVDVFGFQLVCWCVCVRVFFACTCFVLPDVGELVKKTLPPLRKSLSRPSTFLLNDVPSASGGGQHRRDGWVVGRVGAGAWVG
jgi:hypothetical protein